MFITHLVYLRVTLVEITKMYKIHFSFSFIYENTIVKFYMLHKLLMINFSSAQYISLYWEKLYSSSVIISRWLNSTRQNGAEHRCQRTPAVGICTTAHPFLMAHVKRSCCCLFSLTVRILDWLPRFTKTCPKLALPEQSPTPRWSWSEGGSKNWKRGCRSFGAQTGALIPVQTRGCFSVTWAGKVFTWWCFLCGCEAVLKASQWVAQPLSSKCIYPLCLVQNQLCLECVEVCIFSWYGSLSKSSRIFQICTKEEKKPQWISSVFVTELP